MGRQPAPFAHGDMDVLSGSLCVTGQLQLSEFEKDMLTKFRISLLTRALALLTLPYLKRSLRCLTHQGFAYTTPLQGAPSSTYLNINRFTTWLS